MADNADSPRPASDESSPAPTRPGAPRRQRQRAPRRSAEAATPARISKPQHSLTRFMQPKMLLAGFAWFIGVASGIVGLYQFFISNQAPPPTAAPMTGDLNIAIAEFGGLDASGRVGDSEIGQDMSRSVHTALADEMKRLTAAASSTGVDLRVQTRAPDEVGKIAGTSRDEQARNAADTADRLNADVLVYGNLRSESSSSTFVAGMYVSDRTLPEAEEIAVGVYDFGAGLETSADLSRNPAARGELRQRVSARATGLAQFVTGLGYYGLERVEDANGFFGRIEQGNLWADCPCRELLYLLLGNSAGRAQQLSEARVYYQRAAEVNPSFARARLGLAELTFQEAKGECEPGTADVPRLYDALAQFQAAGRTPDQPVVADVPAKVAYGSGRIYVCLSQAGAADLWDQAEAQFESVLSDFRAGNQRLRGMAAEVHAYLGLVRFPNVGAPSAADDLQRSVTDFEQAAALSRRPSLQAEYHVWIARIRARQGDRDAAGRAYARAVELASGPRRAEIEKLRAAL